MGNTREQEHGLQLAQVEAIAASRASGAERDRLISFIRSYYETVPEEVLASLHPPELFAIAHGHFQFAQQRESTRDLVRTYCPAEDQHGWSSDAQVLETVALDRPFLVDSLGIAVRACGGVLRWLVHPVLSIRRDQNGQLQAVTSAAESGPGHESLIHMQFDGISDPEKLAELERRVHQVLGDIRQVVDDYDAMRQHLRTLTEELSHPPPGLDPDDLAEVAALLSWLDDDHFTFLGFAESEKVGEGDEAHFNFLPDSGLGLNRGKAEDTQVVAPARELDKYAGSRRPVIVTKANTRATIHHDEYLDSISVKRFDAAGNVRGTSRFVGLFSTEVYNSLPRSIPLIRRKMAWVIEHSRLRRGSHAAKQLQEILDGLPIDELFQSSEHELLDLATGVRSLRETQQLRLFLRRDRYGRFFSCLVYLQRDQYSSEVRGRMARQLLELLDGTDIEHAVEIQRDGLARIQFIVRTRPGSKSPLTAAELERRLQEATRTWDDALRDTLTKILPDVQARKLAAQFRGAFAASYREQAPAVEAATDLQYLSRLDDAEPMLVRLQERGGSAAGLRLKLYVRGEPAMLSAVLPTLENFGLRVHAQRPYAVQPAGQGKLWIQEFDLEQTGTAGQAPEHARTLFEDAFLRVVRGQVEDDGVNSLVLRAGLDWRQACLLRTLCRYLLQTGWPYSQSYVEQILSGHASIARQLVELFEYSFDPQHDVAQRESQTEALTAAIQEALDAISSLDVDRVLRGFLSVVSACLRTNFYQRGEDGLPKDYISIKLNPAGIPELPLPRPMFEAFVYSPEVEGIHLRGGKVARGGLRWSDRRQDFRTEVLGLVKAQMVKNAVIVPVGAKGGFVVKRSLEGLDRDGFMAAGIACYKTFIRGLLDITDNYVDGELRPPPDVVRLDEDDPYLVVAADKGTATFSDIANSVSAEYGFWLGDAFASGGSAGYDHKKMGITARGAWESVKRHFRELGIDCQTQDFTCIGIGDMAGDVFGNGMLLSRHIRLLAAFNHLHIFIDPNPDPLTSYAERERLFRLPRSSWTDYSTELISKGGGIYPRSAKLIELSPEAQQALGISKSRLTPTALIHEILKAPVDLLWNGGIGTYVKSRLESHLDVGDRANDGLRVDGRDLRCKIVGEGGNLGLTQLGRVEFALQGGRVLTDFNDNAGGVNSSDREVNIKIPLNSLLLSGAMEREARNALLESMTEDVARGVLRDSYLQTQALGQMQHQAVARIDEHANFMRALERDGLLNRAIEFLPDDERIAERRTERRGLTAPEMAVLLSYGKISLFDEVLASNLPDEPALEQDLLNYFPPALRASQAEALKTHRLRREIIATLVTNEVVNRMGVTYVFRSSEDRGLLPSAPVRAYLAARGIFESEARYSAIESLDGQVPCSLQYELMERVSGLIKHVGLWLVRSGVLDSPLAELVERFRAPARAIEEALEDLLPEAYREHHSGFRQSVLGKGASEEVALAHANHHVIGSSLDIISLAEETGQDVLQVARSYFELGQRLSLPWLLSAINGLPVDGRWQALARNNMREEAYALHRQVVAGALNCEGAEPAERVKAWTRANAQRLQFAQHRLSELSSLAAIDFASLTIAMGELQRLSL